MSSRKEQRKLWPWVLVPFLLAAALVLAGASVLEGDSTQSYEYAL